MSDYDLMRLFAQYDGEIDEGDFTPEALERALAAVRGQSSPVAAWKRAYFEKYDDLKDKSLKKQDW